MNADILRSFGPDTELQPASPETLVGRSGATYGIADGRPEPLGATLTDEGVQFAVFSRHAERLTIALFREATDTEPEAEIVLDTRFRTGDIWHCHVSGIGAGALYLVRAEGPYAPEQGQRFNGHLYLLDPYARALTAEPGEMHRSLGYDAGSPRKDAAPAQQSNLAHMPKCVVVSTDFDWQGDKPLNVPLHKAIIYETHVRSLTVHPSSGVEHPGTFRGVIEMIPYLRELGVTSIELMPIQEFDELDNPRHNPTTGERLQDYWGYNTLAYFAPKARYASDRTPGCVVDEFKEMVRELHRAGIEVILDIVFNHTGEGAETGPTVSFRGLDNQVYYMLDDDPRYYRNFSGCGNTVNCNHPVVRSLIVECLRYWVLEMHVDGFRFDLGSVLSRGQDGRILEEPPIVQRIAEDPVLRGTKIIAEAWDAGGAYQVGSFPGGRWAEWNDRYRDDVRSYWRGDPGKLSTFVTRFAGSSDLYSNDGRKPFHSINLITCHDGFTVNDLVSYNHKHNEANGEANRDGHDHNLSCNYGVEGPARNGKVERARNRHIKSLLATLLLSLGTPMLSGGDEFRRTQYGNNNAYCQNNELSWYDYRLREKHYDVLRFTREMIRFRRRHPALLRHEFFTGKDLNENALTDVSWLSPTGDTVDWERHDGAIAVWIDGQEAAVPGGDIPDDDLYIMFNPGARAVEFALPDPHQGPWKLAVDTAGEPGRDIFPPREEPRLRVRRLRCAGRSVVVLVSGWNR